MKIKNTLAYTLIASALFAGASASAAELEVTITNITSGLHFTPILVASHNGTKEQKIFTAGEPASDFSGLEKLAEQGDQSDLASRLSANGATIVDNPASGPLAPGASTTATLTTKAGEEYLSLAAMILPSNDGFIGLDSYKIPTARGTYKLRLNVYDAGTEVNDELKANMPNPAVLTGNYALGDGGTGVFPTTVTQDPNTKIHIHPGNIGDFSQTDGISDMNASVHRWLNPAVAVTVVVK